MKKQLLDFRIIQSIDVVEIIRVQRSEMTDIAATVDLSPSAERHNFFQMFVINPSFNLRVHTVVGCRSARPIFNVNRAVVFLDVGFDLGWLVGHRSSFLLTLCINAHKKQAEGLARCGIIPASRLVNLLRLLCTLKMTNDLVQDVGRGLAIAVPVQGHTQRVPVDIEFFGQAFFCPSLKVTVLGHQDLALCH